VTASGKTGTVNIDEVRCYIPDFAVIGDSISDGKRAGTLSWSSDPSTTHRLTGTPDQASSPNFLLGSFLGDNTFVGSRGFGGSETSQMVTFIQSLIVNQGFKRVFINCGFNDINRGYTAATIEANITAVINTLLSGGIKPRDILIANIFGSTALTGTKATVRDAYNTWLAGYSVTSGIRIVDANTALSTTPSTNSLLSTYDSGDGIHPNKLGSSVLAQTVMNRYYYNFIGVIR
jgi:lysophospholipase L1-like esterase